MTLDFHSSPSTGMGTPQDMSLVMDLSFSPPFTKFSVNALTLERQWVFFASSSMRGFSKAESFNANCLEDLTSGVVPQRVQCGCRTSPGTKVAPQESHWSERTSVAPHLGQIPSTYLSGRNLAHLGQ